MTAGHPKATSREGVLAFFADQRKTVLTFLGYSGAGYERPGEMLARAEGVLERFDPRATIVNIGATTDGIGAVYDLAKTRGFVTSGIISTKALAADVEISPSVDHVFFISDATWGGLLADGTSLSPTSDLMVAVSDVMVAIGGNRIVRDEGLAGRKRGKSVQFIPADRDHALTRAKAHDAGKPEPVDFSGDAAAALSRSP